MKKKFQELSRCFFYLFVFFLPFRIDALIFGPDLFFAGFFNSYAVHFIYLSDLFFVLGLLFFSLSFIFDNAKLRLAKALKAVSVRLQFFVLLFLFAYLFSVLFAANEDNSIFYLLRAAQFLVFYCLIFFKFLSFKNVLRYFVFTVAFQALIGILQFLLQGDLGLHFLGEPLLSASMKSVAKIQLFGHDFLRAYGTFVHPNVFGAYLGVAIFSLFYLYPKRKKILGILFPILSLALLFTFSRGAALALVFGMYFYFRKSNFTAVLFAFLLLALIFSFAPLNTLTERIVHYLASVKMFFENPFGVGAGNFTLVLPDYLNFKLYPWQVQPVHNIFLLVLTELGFLGFFALMSLLFFKAKQLFVEKSPFRSLGLAMFAALIIFGISDHYLISMYQGQFLFWLILSSNSH